MTNSKDESKVMGSSADSEGFGNFSGGYQAC